MSRARNYYNEFDPKAANWLRELMHEGLIPTGDVDERSIAAVRADDLRGYTQCHFFAGIGVWPHALRRAGWDDDRPVGTGSCPCQPFSAAGKQLGFEDPRHLWPAWIRLIAEARQQGQRWTDNLFGEQAPTAGAWIDLVRADLEALGYAFGSPDLPAAGFGGSHIRQRLYWLADANNAEWWADHAPGNDGDWPATGRVEGPGDLAECGEAGWLGDTNCLGVRSEGSGPDARAASGVQGSDGERQRLRPDLGSTGAALVRLGDADGAGLEGWILPSQRAGERLVGPSGVGGDVSWVFCRDGAFRPVEPGSFPLASAAPARVGRLRGYGNALDAETAVNFIAAYLEGERDLVFQTASARNEAYSDHRRGWAEAQGFPPMAGRSVGLRR